MGLTKLSINRPLTMLMIIVALVVFGLRAFTELKVDRYPTIDVPTVSIVTVYPGAGPEDVEAKIVKPVEDAVVGIGGVETIVSKSQENVGIVTVKFLQDVDGNVASDEVQRKIAAMKSTLPDDAEEPTIIKADINASAIMQLVLSGSQNKDDLYAIAKDDIQPRLQSVKGVASVTVSGGRDQQVLIEPDPVQLAAYNVPLEGIQKMVAYNNMSVPSGSLDEGRQRTAVRSMGEFTSIEQMQNTIIAQLPVVDAAPNGMNTGGNIYLKDLATVHKDYADTSVIIRYNGKESVSLSVVKTSDANTVELARQLRAEAAEINAGLPAGAKLEIVSDDSTFTQNSINAVFEDMGLAILITGLVILLFLHNFRSTLIVLFSIPTTLISTFIVMWAMGFSLNVLTLLALTLTIGVLVDDSIVVIENIERHLQMGKSPKTAALEGRSQIGLAAITISLVDVAVYVPVAFSKGVVGQFFLSYGITVVAAVLFSLFISFTLTPMLASLWLKPHQGDEEEKPSRPAKLLDWLVYPFAWVWHTISVLWENMFTLLGQVYAAIIRLALKNVLTQAVVVIIAVAATIGGAMMITSGAIGSELLPQEDDGKFTVILELPGGTNLAATDQAAREAEQIILNNVPETVSILTNVGGSTGTSVLSSSAGSSNKATLFVQTVDKSLRQRTTTEMVETLRPQLQRIPEATVSFKLSTLMEGLSNNVELQIYGDDPAILSDLANQVEATIKTVPGAVDVVNTGAAQSPEARLIVDRERVINQGLLPAQVGATLRTALNGATIGTFNDPSGNDDVDIVLRLNPSARQDLDNLLEIPVGYNNGQQVKLSQVASLNRQLAPAVISRNDRQRSLTITSGASGRAGVDVKKDIIAAINSRVKFPEGYGYRFSASTNIQDQAFSTLGQALVLGIIFMYILMVALFQSWIHPITIMMSLPVATVGAFGGLYLFDHTLNIISLLGLILLAGLVTKNAILLVDFTNDLRREKGMSCKDALVEAARLRLRPILMTSFAMIFAMLPILLGQGAGAEVRSPLAAVVIGGNITSTLLTLILVPVIYNVFDNLGNALAALFSRVTGKTKKITAQPEVA